MTSYSSDLPTVLLIEDEEQLRLTLGAHLRDRGYSVLEAADGLTGIAMYRKHKPDLITLDLRMDPIDGHEVLATIREEDWETPVIIITGHGQFEDVVKALRHGANDYLLKPLSDMAIFDIAMEKSMERSALRRENARLSRAFLSRKLENPAHFSDIITLNTQLQDIFIYCEAIAKTGEPILITGETGVGKELLARALHKTSSRKGRFVPVNIAGLDEQTFSDTLFGHCRGAFTGADRAREGLIGQAQHGSLFLDEIGELNPQAQIRLLRVLQEKEFYPLGSDSARPFNVGIIAATNKSIEELRTGKNFRQDFFYRIATHSVHIPPLRERPEDIIPLLNHFLAQAAEKCRKDMPGLSEELAEAIEGYAFPGNIRELRAMAYDAVTRNADSELHLKDFPILMNSSKKQLKQQPFKNSNLFSKVNPLPTIRFATESLVNEALKRSDGIQKKAASVLGITPQSLSERLKRRN